LWTSDVGGESGEEGVWGTKEDERLLWKGMNTVMDYPEDRLWRDTLRNKWMEMTPK
jgi:hypothetical protein